MEQHKSNWFVEMTKLILFALIVVVPIRFFIAQPYIVNGSSMEPAFESGHYIIIDQLSYRFGEPERGDVVVFRYPRDPSTFFIKRVIGLPGETVEIRDHSVIIRNSSHPGGFPLNEPYIADANMQKDFLTAELEDDEYFVLGDNRRASSDSRVWGTLPDSFIVGEAFLRLLPLGEAGLAPGAIPGY